MVWTIALNVPEEQGKDTEGSTIQACRHQASWRIPRFDQAGCCVRIKQAADNSIVAARHKDELALQSFLRVVPVGAASTVVPFHPQYIPGRPGHCWLSHQTQPGSCKPRLNRTKSASAEVTDPLAVDRLSDSWCSPQQICLDDSAVADAAQHQQLPLEEQLSAEDKAACLHQAIQHRQQQQQEHNQQLSAADAAAMAAAQRTAATRGLSFDEYRQEILDQPLEQRDLHQQMVAADNHKGEVDAIDSAAAAAVECWQNTAFDIEWDVLMATDTEFADAVVELRHRTQTASAGKVHCPAVDAVNTHVCMHNLTAA